MTMNLIIKIYNFILFGFFDNFLKNSIGVIHIGANSGQEKDHYTKLRVERVIWIEADPEIYEILLRNIKNYKNFKAYNYLVTDKNKKKVKFNIANNDSNSSSIFELKDSKRLYPSLNYTKSILLNSKNLKTIVNEKKINLNNFDSLVLDVQGAELEILKGGGDLINKFKYIKLEAAEFHMYSRNPLYSEISKYLYSLGFKEIKKTCIAKNYNGKKAYDVLYLNLHFRHKY